MYLLSSPSKRTKHARKCLGRAWAFDGKHCFMLHLVHGRMWRVNWVVTGFAVEDFDGALLLDGTKGPSRAWVYNSSHNPQSDLLT